MRSKRLNEEEWREMLFGNGTFLSGIPTNGLSSRRLELRGRTEPLSAWSERVPAAVS
jgi:hypothetical protein